jgi:hypothetical protein
VNKTTQRINRHATELLRAGYESGSLVSSVKEAMKDLNAVRMETVQAGLGLSDETMKGPFAFLEATGNDEKAEVQLNGSL